MSIVAESGVPGGIRTHGPQIRNLVLYPAELREPPPAFIPGLSRARQAGQTVPMASLPGKIIVSCAVTGAIATPSMSHALPITPEQIAGAAIDAAQAGAAIIHLHARDPATGEPSPDPALFRRFLPAIAAKCDAILNVTTGGGLKMSLDERLAAARDARPEMCSLNMGSMNFNISVAAERPRTWLHDWEQPYLARTTGHIFRNTFDDIARIVGDLGADGTRFEFECYDVGHLYNLAHCLDRRTVQPPLYVQLIFGILGGIGAEPANLLFMRDTAQRLFGDAFAWSVLGAGRHQMGFATIAAVLGGNVRVGLEDSLYIGRGELAASNAQQVAKIVRIVRELGLEPATPGEVRALLALKGPDRVGF